MKNDDKIFGISNTRMTNILMTMMLLFGAAMIFMPFLWAFSVSFQPAKYAFDLPPHWVPKDPTIQNYKSLASSDVPFFLFFWNSLKITSLVTIGQLITCSMAGFAFAKLRFPFKNILFILVLSTLMIPI